MKKYKNFKQYMEDNFYDVIFNRLKGYVAENKDRFESDEIYDISFARLEDFKVSGVTFDEGQNNYLDIRVTVDAEIEIKGKTRFGYESDGITKCYNVFFSALLENGLHNTRITNIDEYNERAFNKRKSLSQDLLHYLYEEHIEEAAEDFLRRNYPKALLQPMPVPAEDVAKGMGMEIHFAPMEDGTFGKTYFAEEKVQVYDSILQKEILEIKTRPGTMLINPNVYFMYNVGTANNTIIHECVHWDRHRRTFELQKLLNGDCNYISCEIVETYEGIPEDAPALQWMEWQANQLAPRILMPEKTTRKIFNDTLIALHQQNPLRRYAEIVEDVVGRIATYFGVSYIAAKIRLIELGYDNVEGTGVFCNGKHMPPFYFAKGSLGKNQTYIIDEQNAVYVIYTNPALRELFFETKIVYANCTVCLNTPKYIEMNKCGVPVLTEYALEHMHECCFVFNRKISASTKYSDTFYRRCFLCRDVTSETFIEASYDPGHKDNQSKLDRREELSKVAVNSKAIAKIMEGLPQGFGKTLKYHMKRLDINESELSERSHLSAQTISKYINQGSAEKKYVNVVAICKALCMNPVFVDDLIAKAGYDKKYDMEAYFVKFLIWNHPDDTVDEWQKKIDDAHVKLQLPKEKE